MVLATNPKHSTTGASMKKINYIQTKTSIFCYLIITLHKIHSFLIYSSLDLKFLKWPCKTVLKHIAISVWYWFILMRWSSWMINIPFHLWNKVTMPYWSSSWLMLHDKMILLFLEEGMEGKVELRCKNIIFVSIFTHLQSFKPEINFLNCAYKEAVRQRFVIYLFMPNLWGEHAETILICLHSHQKRGSCCAPKQNEGLLLQKLVFSLATFINVSISDKWESVILLINFQILLKGNI